MGIGAGVVAGVSFFEALTMRQVIGFFGVVLMLLSGTLAYARRDEPEQWIAFISDRDGNPEIYRMRPDGSDVQQLTHTEGVVHCWIKWSIQGAWLYYQWDYFNELWPYGCYGSGFATFKILADGSNSSQLNLKGQIRSESKNGWWVITVGWDNNTASNVIYRESLDRKIHQVLTKGFQPMLSPDQRKVVFRNEDSICVIGVDGQEQSCLELNDYIWSSYLTPALIWSSDSESIIFNASPRDGDTTGLYQVSIYGGSVRIFSESSGAIDENFPLLLPSPNNEWLAYIYLGMQMTVMKASGGEPAKIASYDAPIGGWGVFDWSPDSRWLVFTDDDEEGHSRIWRIHPDGTGLEQLTFGPGEDLRPAWSPVIDKTWNGWELMGIGAGVVIFRYPVRHWARKNKTNGIS